MHIPKGLIYWGKHSAPYSGHYNIVIVLIPIRTKTIMHNKISAGEILLRTFHFNITMIIIYEVMIDYDILHRRYARENTENHQCPQEFPDSSAAIVSLPLICGIITAFFSRASIF